MNNAKVLMMFFGLLGLVCLLVPKLIHVMYREITNLGSEISASEGSNVASARLNTIRIVGVGILVVVGLLYYF